LGHLYPFWTAKGYPEHVGKYWETLGNAIWFPGVSTMCFHTISLCKVCENTGNGFGRIPPCAKSGNTTPSSISRRFHCVLLAYFDFPTFPGTNALSFHFPAFITVISRSFPMRAMWKHREMGTCRETTTTSFGVFITGNYMKVLAHISRISRHFPGFPDVSLDNCPYNMQTYLKYERIASLHHGLQFLS
jgi:hypothetical protein